jgi:hypothetical protein
MLIPPYKGDILKKRLIILVSISSLFISAKALELNFFISKVGSQRNFIKRDVDNNITPRDRNPYINMLRGENSKGHKIFQKYLQEPCQMSAKTFAAKHTQDEWEEIAESGALKEYIIQLCPNIQGTYQEEWSDDLYQFFYKYAYDSDNLLIS